MTDYATCFLKRCNGMWDICAIVYNCRNLPKSSGTAGNCGLMNKKKRVIHPKPLLSSGYYLYVKSDLMTLADSTLNYAIATSSFSGGTG